MQRFLDWVAKPGSNILLKQLVDDVLFRKGVAFYHKVSAWCRVLKITESSIMV